LSAAGLAAALLFTAASATPSPAPTVLPAPEAAPAPSPDAIHPEKTAGLAASAGFTTGPVRMGPEIVSSELTSPAMTSPAMTSPVMTSPVMTSQAIETTKWATPIPASPLAGTPQFSTPGTSHAASNAPAAIPPAIQAAETSTRTASSLADEYASGDSPREVSEETKTRPSEINRTLPKGKPPHGPPAVSFANPAPTDTAGPSGATALKEPLSACPVPAGPPAPPRRLGTLPKLSPQPKEDLLKPPDESGRPPVWEPRRSAGPSAIASVDGPAPGDSTPVRASEPNSIAGSNLYLGDRPAEAALPPALKSATPARVWGEMAFALRLTGDAAQASPEQPPLASGSPTPAGSNGKLPPQPPLDAAPSPPPATAAANQQSSGGPPQERGRRRPDASIRPPAEIQPGAAENTRPEPASPVLHTADGLKPEPSASPARTGDPQPVRSQTAPEPAAAEVRTPAPLREFSLSVRSAPVASDQGEAPRVGLRVRLNGDEVQVAVHTPDPRASEQLRRDLGSLADRLDQSGYHTETWRPAQGGPAASAPSRRSDPETGSNPGGTPDEGSRGGRQGEQRQPQRQRPAWVEALEQQKERLS
jgi:chemotaxis protein MotD